MTKNENYLPIKLLDINGRFECEAIVDDSDGLNIKISDFYGKNYRLNWKDGVVAYQTTDESDRISLVSNISAASLIGNILIECLKSNYIEWIINERMGINIVGIRHFIVITSNNIIDVIDYDPPELIVLDK